MTTFLLPISNIAQRKQHSSAFEPKNSSAVSGQKPTYSSFLYLTVDHQMIQGAYNTTRYPQPGILPCIWHLVLLINLENSSCALLLNLLLETDQIAQIGWPSIFWSECTISNLLPSISNMDVVRRIHRSLWITVEKRSRFTVVQQCPYINLMIM